MDKIENEGEEQAKTLELLNFPNEINELNKLKRYISQ